ncbi:MAG: metallophosphoesterase [Verrucomicrobiota bacterium]
MSNSDRFKARMGTRLTRAPQQVSRACGLALLAAWLAGCASVPSQPQPFSFVQMCDPQIGLTDYAAELARFRRAVEQINQLRPDFVVICGDLVEGASRESFADFNAAKAGLRVPCYCAPGNRDLGEAPTLQSLRFYRESIGRDYYSFEHQGCVFIIVDTQLWKAYVGEESEKQDAWLKQTLAAAARKGRRIFVVGHIPLFARTAEEPNGHDNLPLEKRRELLALFERHGVQVLLAGHTHRTLVRDFDGIQMVTAETTSLNLDFHPFGFRLWHIGAARPYRHEFIMLKLGSNSRSDTLKR